MSKKTYKEKTIWAAWVYSDGNVFAKPVKVFRDYLATDTDLWDKSESHATPAKLGFHSEYSIEASFTSHSKKKVKAFIKTVNVYRNIVLNSIGANERGRQEGS